MKSIKALSLLFVCVPIMVTARPSKIIHEDFNKLPEEYELSVKEIELEYCAVINDVLTQARESIAAKEDIMSPEWLAHKDKEQFGTIKNIMSDVSILSSFTHSTQETIRKRLQEYLQIKIGEEIDKALAINDVTVADIDDFFYLSEMVCDISKGINSKGINCHKMVHTIKRENDMILKQLAIKEEAGIKMREMMQKKAKKNQVHKLRERIILGAHPRQ